MTRIIASMTSVVEELPAVVRRGDAPERRPERVRVEAGEEALDLRPLGARLQEPAQRLRGKRRQGGEAGAGQRLGEGVVGMLRVLGGAAELEEMAHGVPRRGFFREARLQGRRLVGDVEAVEPVEE